jgi:hypothetical protein
MDRKCNLPQEVINANINDPTDEQARMGIPMKKMKLA